MSYWLLLAALFVAICTTTFAMIRLAPKGARVPRSVLMALIFARWISDPANARSAIRFGLVVLASFMGLLFFDRHVAMAVVLLVSAAAAISLFRAR